MEETNFFDLSGDESMQLEEYLHAVASGALIARPCPLREAASQGTSGPRPRARSLGKQP